MDPLPTAAADRQFLPGGWFATSDTIYMLTPYDGMYDPAPMLLVDAESGAIRNAASPPGTFVDRVIAPDSLKALYTMQTPKAGLLISDVPAGGNSLITAAGTLGMPGDPIWSPDGKAIAYAVIAPVMVDGEWTDVELKGIAIYTIATKTEAILRPQPPDTDDLTMHESRPQLWLPNNTLVYTQEMLRDGHGEQQLEAVDVTTSKVTVLDHASSIEVLGYFRADGARIAALAATPYLTPEVPSSSNRDLTAAAADGDLGLVRSIVEATDNLDPDATLTAPLFEAAEKGHVDVVRYLLDMGSSSRAEQSGNHWRVAEFAARGGHIGVAQLLVERGVAVNGGRPLWVAARWGNTDMVRWLLQQGSPINYEEDQGSTPLSQAASMDRGETARVLLEAGAAYTAADVSRIGDNQRLAGLLDAAPSLVNEPDKAGATLLSAAAKHGQVSTIQLLVARGADITGGKTSTGRLRPLNAAAAAGHLDAVRALVSLGADINATEETERSPLASAREHQDVASWLESVGAQESLFDLASSDNADSLEKRLVEDQNSVHLGNSEGETLLHVVGGVTSARVLIRAGAVVTVRDNNGSTPLHNATLVPEPVELLRLLLEAGADINATDSSGQTPLDYAARNERWDAEMFLSGQPSLATPGVRP